MMTKYGRLAGKLALFPVLNLAILAMPIRLFADEDVTGEWEMKMDFNGREVVGTVTISRKGNSLEGKWGSTRLSDVKFGGGKLTFVRNVSFGDREFRTTYEGTLKDGKLSGTVSGDQGSYAANGSRRKPKSPALGRWNINYRINDRDIDATLAISQTSEGGLDGKWTSNTGEHVVSSFKFQDGKLTFSRKSKIGEREFETTYEGTIRENRLTGIIKSQIGDIEANGKRAGGELVGQWELTSTADGAPRTRILTVHGDLSGTYEVFGNEVPLKEVKIEGDQVTFNAEAGFGDQTFKLDFKGKLEGKTLKGEVTSPRGTREVAGKRIEAVSPSPLVGTWEITRESQQGPRTATLTIKEDLTGTYTIRDSTAAISDLRFEGDQLTFKVTVKYGDREVPQEFKGKVEGTALKGTFTTPRGERQATGKKVNATSL